MNNKESLPLIQPMLATKSEPFNSNDYIYEVKWDGYRALAYLYKDRTELRSRNLTDITAVFPELGNLHVNVIHTPVIVDGEIVILSGRKPSFSCLQARGRLSDPSKILRASLNSPAIYIVFDILYVDNQWITDFPLERRKDVLSKHIIPGKFLALSDFISGQGITFARIAGEMGLEGVVAKALSSPYIPGKRSVFWRKIRNINDIELIICGFRPGAGGRRLGSLLLCGYDNGDLCFCGKVGTGFSQDTEEELLNMLEPMINNDLNIKIPDKERQGAFLVDPFLVCTVEYLEKTKNGCLRHPSFKGLRFDKDKGDCLIP